MRIRLNNGGVGSKDVDVSGGTMSAPLKLVGAPTGPMDAVTSSYVDAVALTFSGGGVTGVFDAARLPAFTGSEVSSAGGGVFTLSTTGVTAGTYAKVVVDSKGRVTGGGTLMSSDIPSLSWCKLVDRPTTLSGYGITDVVSLSGATMTGPLSLNNAPAASGELANKAYVDTRVGSSGGSAFVTGDIIRRSSPTTPAGYLRCNGSDISKNTYSNLYSVLGDKHSYIISPGVQPGSGTPWYQQYEFNNASQTDITGWEYGNNLPVSRERPCVVMTSGTNPNSDKVHLIGGYETSTSYAANMYSASVSPDGMLGTWSLTSTFYNYRYRYQAVMVSGTTPGTDRLLIIALDGGGSVQGSVYSAPVLADGNIGAWIDEPNLPLFFTNGKIFRTKNRVYFLSHSLVGEAIYSAEILENGRIGAWGTTSNLPISPNRVTYDSLIAVTKSRVYIIGGSVTSDPNTSRVITAAILPNGTLGSWTTGIPVPQTVAGSTSNIVVTKNRVYLLAWVLNNEISSTVYTAPINSDGTFGTWVLGTSLPAVMAASSVIVTKGRIHLIGGYIGSYATNWSRTMNAPFLGGSNNYSDIYNNIVPVTNINSFRLPDLSLSDKPGSYSYIKI